MFKRYRIGKRNFTLPQLLLITFIIILLMVLFKHAIATPESKEAKQAVEEFYLLESSGNFAGSWEMFHPLMKERFSKPHYIQDRAHVFLNHFGVDTFAYTVSDADKMENWSMSATADPIEIVYKTKVTLTYKGKYGNFDIHQDVFASKSEGVWTILWDYGQ